MKRTFSNFLGFIVLILFAISCANSGKTNYDTVPKKLVSTSSSPAPLSPEIALIDEEPQELELRTMFNKYLRTRLRDYESSEYIDFSVPVRVKVQKQPYWLSVLRLRAKNAFGAYSAKDIKMYIRNKEVVFAKGL